MQSWTRWNASGSDSAVAETNNSEPGAYNEGHTWSGQFHPWHRWTEWNASPADGHWRRSTVSDSAVAETDTAEPATAKQGNSWDGQVQPVAVASTSGSFNDMVSLLVISAVADTHTRVFYNNVSYEVPWEPKAPQSTRPSPATGTADPPTPQCQLSPPNPKAMQPLPPARQQYGSPLADAEFNIPWVMAVKDKCVVQTHKAYPFSTIPHWISNVAVDADSIVTKRICGCNMKGQVIKSRNTSNGFYDETFAYIKSAQHVRSPSVLGPDDKFCHQSCHCCGYQFEPDEMTQVEWCSECWCPHCSRCLDDGEDFPCRACVGLDVRDYYQDDRDPRSSS